MTKVTTLRVGDDELAFECLKDSMGRFRTQSLFVEHKVDGYVAPFSLKEYDHKGALSMYKKYMDYADPTEYSAALGLLGSWRHWQQLTSAKWFAPYIEQWRAELKVKLEHDRFTELKEAAKNGNVTATKALDERYSGGKGSKRGRPSKKERAEVAKMEREEAKILAEERERMGL